MFAEGLAGVNTIGLICPFLAIDTAMLPENDRFAYGFSDVDLHYSNLKYVFTTNSYLKYVNFKVSALQL